MPTIARSLEEALSSIADGASLLIPREGAGVAMAATRALIRRGIRRLTLIATPTSSLQADLLIGAGCVTAMEAAANRAVHAALKPYLNGSEVKAS